MLVAACLLQIIKLGLESIIEASLGPSLKLFELGLENVVETRVQSGNT
jgi:hypothetical protein